MAIIITNETKETVIKKYNRCCKIEIKSIKADDGNVVETITQYYESITEIDGLIISRSNLPVHEYRCDYLLAIKWDAPWKAGITGLDVMAFIKWFNDNYEEALAQLAPIVIEEPVYIPPPTTDLVPEVPVDPVVVTDPAPEVPVDPAPEVPVDPVPDVPV